MLIIEKTFRFEASHQLVDHDGKCARPHGHSYSFTLEVSGGVCGPGPKRNMVLDYDDVGQVGKDIHSLLDHRNLNEVTGESMTTAEFLCLWIWNLASERIPDLWAVRVKETDNTSCRYCPIESRLIDLGREAIQDIRSRLYSQVKIGEPEECWPFQGSVNEEGYGYCTYRAAGINTAHRLAAWLAGMEVKGMYVLHTCDNPPCCNPAHLKVGTHIDNERDKDSKGRRPKGEEHGGSKVSEDSIRLLWNDWKGKRSRVSKGSFCLMWGQRLEVVPNQINNILDGWSWNHITGLPKRFKGRS